MQRFGLEILFQRRQRVKRQRVEKLQRGQAVRRRMDRMMRALIEKAGFRVLHFTQDAHPLGALFRLAFKIANRIQDIRRVRATVFVHAHLARAFRVLPEIAAVRPFRQLMAIHNPLYFCNKSVNVHSFSSPSSF